MASIDERLEALRTKRSSAPDSAAAGYLAERGLLDEGLGAVAALERYVAVLTAAFDGELDAHQDSDWMGYIGEKAEGAEKMARRLVELTETALGLPPAPGPAGP